MKSGFASRLVREPLVQFIVFGALLFGADRVIAARHDNRKVIELTPAVDQEARAIFKGALGHDPSPTEMQTLRERWIDNEVLYREGLALRVDQGDAAIRERVIFKALEVMQSNLTLPKIDEAGLRAWFIANRANYDEPARFDFLEAVLIGDRSPQAVAAFIADLSAGIQGEAQSGLRIFKARPRSNLVASYGEAFAGAMDTIPVHAWRAVQGKDGVRIVRLEGRTAAQPSSFEAVQGRIYADWKDAQLQKLRTAAVRDLGKKYQVRIAENAK
jgi:hypothetical protein